MRGGACLGKFGGFEENKSAFLIFYAVVARSLYQFAREAKFLTSMSCSIHAGVDLHHHHCDQNRHLTLIFVTHGAHHHCDQNPHLIICHSWGNLGSSDQNRLPHFEFLATLVAFHFNPVTVLWVAVSN